MFQIDENDSVNTVFLIGMPGVGKSKIGKGLAKALGLDFIDSDKYIEKQEGLLVEEIFNIKGAAYFRDLETHFLNQTKLEGVLVSCGGGMPIYNQNLRFMKSKGLVVALYRSLEELKYNVKASKKVRPMFAGLDEFELEKTLQKLLNERTLVYQQAHVNVILPVKKYGSHIQKHILTHLIEYLTNKT